LKGATKFDAALQEARDEREGSEARVSTIERLRAQAPDLAKRVDEGMELDDAEEPTASIVLSRENGAGIALYLELNLLPLPQMDTAETACRRQELDALLLGARLSQRRSLSSPMMGDNELATL
jgi:hypothetical protein